MSKIIRNKSSGPKFKATRSLRTAIWFTGKDTYARRASRPGPHGKKPVVKSRYGTQLEAKQRVKVHYGMSEKQFKNLFLLASKKKGTKTENFAQLLESRLSTLVYRAGFAPSIFAARQLISHKHIMVNGKKVNISSYTLKMGDVVSVVEKDASKNMIKATFNEVSKKIRIPEYLEVDADKLSFVYKFYPTSSQISLPFVFDLANIKLLYS